MLNHPVAVACEAALYNTHPFWGPPGVCSKPRAIEATPRVGRPQLYPWSPEAEARLKNVQPAGWYTLRLIY